MLCPDRATSRPRGTGKIAAALYPAVRQALETARRVVFLTAKTLQQQLAVETIKRMQRGGWLSIQIRAKARMCANAEVICHEEFCLHARDYGAKLVERGVLPALSASDSHLDPDRIYEVAHAAEVCPFEVPLELLRDCSAIVCDYNYVFDPAIPLFGTPGQGDLEDTFLIVDEAHNLVDRAREYFSPRLAASRVRAARELLPVTARRCAATSTARSPSSRACSPTRCRMRSASAPVSRRSRSTCARWPTCASHSTR